MKKEDVIGALERMKEGTYGVVAATISDCQRVIGEMEDDARWIPVKERSPDIWKDVLVYSEFDGVSVDYYDGGSFGYEHVTFWMPLPEVPKEDVGV